MDTERVGLSVVMTEDVGYRVGFSVEKVTVGERVGLVPASSVVTGCSVERSRVGVGVVPASSVVKGNVGVGPRLVPDSSVVKGDVGVGPQVVPDSSVVKADVGRTLVPDSSVVKGDVGTGVVGVLLGRSPQSVSICVMCAVTSHISVQSTYRFKNQCSVRSLLHSLKSGMTLMSVLRTDMNRTLITRVGGKSGHIFISVQYTESVKHTHGSQRSWPMVTPGRIKQSITNHILLSLVSETE